MQRDAADEDDVIDESSVHHNAQETMQDKPRLVRTLTTSQGINETQVLIDEATTKQREDTEHREHPKKKSPSLYRVIRLMASEWYLLIFGCIGASLGGCIFPFYGFLLSKVVVLLNGPKDRITPGPLEGSNLYSFLFSIVGLVGFFGITMQTLGFEYAGARLTRRLRSATFKKILVQEVGYFDQADHSVGSLTSALAVDAAGVNEMITKVWGDVFQLVACCVAGLTISFFHSWQMTLVVMAALPFIVGATAFESRVHQGFEDKTKKAYKESGQIASEAFSEIKTVQSLTCEKFWEERYAENIMGPHRMALKKAFVASIGYGAHQGFNMWANALGFYAGIRFIAHGMVNFDDMFVVIICVTLTAGSMGRASLFVPKFVKGRNCAKSTFEVLDRQTSIDPQAPGVQRQIDGEIHLEQVAFRYPSRPDVPVLNGRFRLDAKKNNTVALVGASGCGKSTTIGLIQRWYDPLLGDVQIDGNSVSNYQLHDLRSQMSLVGQEPVLFDMTVRENILLGMPEGHAEEKDIEEALKTANAYNFISELPKKLDTRVGDKGAQLSGGQKQRIAIARALIRKPKILLLDEATSALDSESEKVVQEALDRATEGRTTITIAHRLSTIQDADTICVVKDGRIVEQGKHFELLEMNGLYKELVEQQNLNVLEQ